MAVLDIRGTHGSGKSWIVHQLLRGGPHKAIQEDRVHLGYYIPRLRCAVVGKYTTACGGCDGVGSADEVVRRVRLFATQYRYTVLEGILVSHTFKRYSRLAAEIGDYRFLFLNTPLPNCIARVRARRRRNGNTRLLDPGNVIKDHASVFTRVRQQVIAAGQKAIILNWEDPMPGLLLELSR